MNVSHANRIQFYWAHPVTAQRATHSAGRPALPQTLQPRFFRQGAYSTQAATYARIARTYLGARVSAISDIRPDAVAHTHACPDVFTFKPLDRFNRVRRACRIARRVMPSAWLRVLIKE